MPLYAEISFSYSEISYSELLKFIFLFLIFLFVLRSSSSTLAISSDPASTSISSIISSTSFSDSDDYEGGIYYGCFCALLDWVGYCIEEGGVMALLFTPLGWEPSLVLLLLFCYPVYACDVRLSFVYCCLLYWPSVLATPSFAFK